MSEARWIICEKSGHWASTLRGAFTAAGIRIHETRSLSECWRELEQSPCGIVGLELTANTLDGLIPWMIRFRRRFPCGRMVMLADNRWRHLEWLSREAGAIHFFDSGSRPRPLVSLVRRHLEQNPAAGDSEQDLMRNIWERLPWSTPLARNG
jgi:DNA-binding response OmpR family regulator